MGESDARNRGVDARPEAETEASRPAPTPDPTAEAISDGIDLVAALVRVALGAAGHAVSAIVSTLDRALREDEEPPPQAPSDEGVAGFLRLLPGAALGMGLEVHRRAFGAARSVGERVAPAADFVVSSPPVRTFRKSANAWLEAWERHGREEQAANSDLAVRYLDDAFPRIIDAVLDRTDLNAIIARVDLDAVLAQIDMDAVLARLDFDALVSRIDVQSVLDRVEIQGIVDRVDLDAVAANIDIEAIVHRLDVAAIAQGVLDKLDLTAIAHRVIDEMELGEIIRESTGTVTVEAVDALRAGGMNADRFVARVVDRMLMRRRGRRLEVGSNGAALPPAASNGHQPGSAGEAEAEAVAVAAVETIAVVEAVVVAEALVEATARNGDSVESAPDGASPDEGAATLSEQAGQRDGE